MRASDLAEQLKAHGVEVLRVMEPTELEDGIVLITRKVHVQVPFNEKLYPPGVVRYLADGEPDFYDCRTSIKALVADIRTAIAQSEAVAG